MFENVGIRFLLVDQDNEPLDIVQELSLVVSENSIIWKPGVLDPVKDFDGFKAQIEAWHREHNPYLFDDEV